jgi:hypothetical protein
MMTRSERVREAGASNIDLRNDVNGAKYCRGCSKEVNLREIVIVGLKKELQIWNSRLINKRNPNITNQLIEQSTSNSTSIFIFISIFSREFSKSNIFYYIDQWHEYIGSETSSSSEDG